MCGKQEKKLFISYRHQTEKFRMAAMFLFSFYKNFILTKVEHFLTIYNHASFQDPKLSAAWA